MRIAAAALSFGLVWGLTCGSAAWAALPRIADIAFEGNDTTQPGTMLREIVVSPGEPADPGRIERSRQGIQDLGLFKSVDVRQTPLPDGRVIVTFVVAEKWYVLPLPRLDLNSERQSAYGAQLRWNNFLGLNHTIGGLWVVRNDQRDNTGSRTSYSAYYSMPFAFDSAWNVSLSGSRTRTPVTEPVDYDESMDAFGLFLGRSLESLGPASTGWSAGSSIEWSNQNTFANGLTGATPVPDPYGHALALGLSTGFRDLRDNIVSKEGMRYSFGVRQASTALGSDYAFTQLYGEWERFIPVGHRPHQTLELSAAAGTYAGGPTQRTIASGPYSLGGADRMRGHDNAFLEGDAYYHLAVEYAHPVRWRWLHAVALVEAGNVFADWSDATLNRVYVDVGVGLRVHITFLVDVRIQAGIAMPIDGNGGGHFFASRI